MREDIIVSVVIPIYNVSKWIDRGMDVILSQSLKEIEVLLVDDGSTDDSAEKCRARIEKDDRVRLISKENGGAGSARNAGIDEAKGRYVYFFDIDDHLRRILKNTKKNQVDLALAQFVKNIKNKFIILIVISMIITIFGFFYIACFNIVYPYIKHEWLKCSILMILLMQILNLLSTLLGACCRYFSIKWQNVKLFRLSLNLN